MAGSRSRWGGLGVQQTRLPPPNPLLSFTDRLPHRPAVPLPELGALGTQQGLSPSPLLLPERERGLPLAQLSYSFCALVFTGKANENLEASQKITASFIIKDKSQAE